MLLSLRNECQQTHGNVRYGKGFDANIQQHKCY